MRIINAFVYSGTAQFVKRDITIAGQYFIEGSPGDELIDATDLYAIPGLVDLHSAPLEEGDSLDALCARAAKAGTTALCPTLVGERAWAGDMCRRYAQREDDAQQASALGLHLELQDPQQPGVPLIERCQAAGEDVVAAVTFSQDHVDAQEILARYHEELSCGIHPPGSDYDTVCALIKQGLNRGAASLEALAQITPTHPTGLGAIFDSPPAMLELALDPERIHPSTVRGTFQMYGEDRVVLVSAGTDGTLLDALRLAVNEMDIPLETAVRAATMNPAAVLGWEEQVGALSPGNYADLLLVDEALNLQQIILRGQPLL